jgi:hypothetical protein
MPGLADLRDSGSIEQDADIIMFLYREDYYDPDTEEKNLLHVLVQKNRQGEFNKKGEQSIKTTVLAFLYFIFFYQFFPCSGVIPKAGNEMGRLWLLSEDILQ